MALLRHQAPQEPREAVEEARHLQAAAARLLRLLAQPALREAAELLVVAVAVGALHPPL